MEVISINVGDRLGIGSAEFVVTQPRMPCFKLEIRFNRAAMIRRFLHNQELLRRVSRLPELPEGWRDYFRKRLWQPDE